MNVYWLEQTEENVPVDNDWLSENEATSRRWSRDASAGDRPRLLASLWSAEESALKALHEGLRLDMRCVNGLFVAGFDLNGWSPLQVRIPAVRSFTAPLDVSLRN
jgi:hypothetical protein